MKASGEREPLAYTKQAAAAAIGVSYSHFNQLIAESKIRPLYSGAKPLIPRVELERYLESLPTERPGVGQ